LRLLASSEAIAAQVDVVAERMMVALEQRHADRVAVRAAVRTATGEPDPAWELDGVEVTFGVQLTGEASIAVFSATGESSAEIVLHFSRPDRTVP